VVKSRSVPVDGRFSGVPEEALISMFTLARPQVEAEELMIEYL
jgi:hypothetical protein